LAVIKFSLYADILAVACAMDGTTIALQSPASACSMHSIQTGHDAVTADTLSIWLSILFLK